MIESLNPRRWIRFSLRTLFLWVTICAMGIGWFISSQVAVVERRREMQSQIVRRGGMISEPVNPASQSHSSFLRRLLGDRPVSSIYLNPNTFNEEDRKQIQQQFPEASVGIGWDIYDAPLHRQSEPPRVQPNDQE